MKSQIVIQPNVTIEVLQGGEVVKRQQVRNLVTASGLNVVRELLLRGVKGTATGYAPTHVALGSGTTAASASDAALVTENYRDAITVKSSAVATATFQLFLDTDVGNDLTFTEAGLFDSPTNGEMLSRVVFAEINKTSSIQVAITWDINLAAS